LLHFIVNARSGKGRGNTVLKKLCDYCYQNGIGFSAHITSRAGHATQIARVLCEQGAETLAAVGGDGTFSEVLNGLDLKTPLGFIPAGRGNDYAKSAGLHLDPIAALKDILNAKPKTTDFFTVGTERRRCLNVAGTGLDVAVLERVIQKGAGKLSYLSSLLYCINHFTPFKLQVSVNGETTRHDCIMAGVCNGGYIGGGMNLSPFSRVADGKLNLVIVRVPANGKLMSALLKFKKGGHIDQEYTSHILCDEVSVLAADGESYPVQIDGEIFRDTVLTCKLVKGGFTTFQTSKKPR
jgi:YegS/Rv2252/BmrU family lipid kinase